jgi:hypothetical protein
MVIRLVILIVVKGLRLALRAMLNFNIGFYLNFRHKKTLKTLRLTSGFFVQEYAFHEQS